MNSEERTELTQYLRIIGRLYPDNRLELRPSYLTEKPNDTETDPKNALIAELYDASGELLLRAHIALIPYCADGLILPELAVRGKIPFPPATRVVKFYRDGIKIHEIQVSEGKPSVRVTWEPGNSVAGQQTITWLGEHPEGRPLEYFLRYSHTDGVTWQRLSMRTRETSYNVNFDDLPGGDQCRVAVVATDGVNTQMEETRSFHVDIKACRAMIFAPEDDSTFMAGDVVWLRGQGFYLEEGEVETEALVWTSSVDGELGRGPILRITAPSPGSHRITLTAGEGDRAGETSVSVRVLSNSQEV